MYTAHSALAYLKLFMLKNIHPYSTNSLPFYILFRLYKIRSYLAHKLVHKNMILGTTYNQQLDKLHLLRMYHNYQYCRSEQMDPLDLQWGYPLDFQSDLRLDLQWDYSLDWQ